MEEPQNPEHKQSGSRLGVGATLREAREQMGLSVAEVASRLKFTPRQISALEEEDFGQLPQMIFIRGFVRSYARLLEIDENSLLEALPGAPVQAPPMAAKSARTDVLPGSGRAVKQNMLWLAAALGVAVITTILAWKYSSEETASRVAPAARPAPVAGAASGVQQIVATAASSVSSEFPMPASQADGASAVNPAAASAPASVERPPRKLRPAQPVKVEFVEDSWVRIRDAGGKVVLSVLGKAGSSQTVAGSPPLAVVIGNARGVKLYYRNEPVDLGEHAENEAVRLKLE